MTTFQRLARKPPKCDICGGPMFAVPGCGWDNDRIYCLDYKECGAEIVFPTSTEEACANGPVPVVQAEENEPCRLSGVGVRWH